MRPIIPVAVGLLALGLSTSGCDYERPTPEKTATKKESPAPGVGQTEANSVDIWTPAALGDVKLLELRLSQAPDVDALDPTFGATALALAADFGKPDAVRACLAAGADVNALNKNRSSPALGAAFFGRPECLRILLEAGADPDLADESGTTTFTALAVPWEITKLIADMMGMPVDQAMVEQGRDECESILESYEG